MSTDFLQASSAYAQPANRYGIAADGRGRADHEKVPVTPIELTTDACRTGHVHVSVQVLRFTMYRDQQLRANPTVQRLQFLGARVT
jgi:hypothetical protein